MGSVGSLTSEGEPGDPGEYEERGEPRAFFRSLGSEGSMGVEGAWEDGWCGEREAQNTNYFNATQYFQQKNGDKIKIIVHRPKN